MITKENKHILEKSNYIRKASANTNYWLDFTQSSINKYLSSSVDFNIIIYSELNTSANYYVIPYSALKNVLIEKYYTKDQKEKRKRWVGNIIDDKLKIASCPIIINVEKYYLGEINTAKLNLLKVIESDIDSNDAEYDSKFEGGKKQKLVNYFERNPRLRADAIEIHGTKCKACNFDFRQFYGIHGESYIEVHHLVPISSLKKSTWINPKTDMIVLCSNCHRMVHRRKDNPLSIEELIRIISKK